MVALSAIVGCRDDKTEMVQRRSDPETTPTILTRDVNTLISDSGITRYKITTPLWLMFEEADDPTWRFPEGIHLEKFDAKFKTEASIDCDSATYFKLKQLWRLDGYVNIRNTLGEKFLTEQLFWDQRRQKIYSDSFIHIERAGRIIEGYGFESNENMTDYNVLRVSGIFPASQFSTDSTSSRPGRSRDTIMPIDEPKVVNGVEQFNPDRPNAIISDRNRLPQPTVLKDVPMAPGRAIKPAPQKAERLKQNSDPAASRLKKRLSN